MAPYQSPQKMLWRELDMQGEEKVRDRLAKGDFTQQIADVEKWLDWQSQRNSFTEARQANRRARSTHLAAWIAAIAAGVTAAVLLVQCLRGCGQ